MRKLTNQDRTVGLAGIVRARLAAGWVPFIRMKDDKEEEVWAKPAVGDAGLPEIGRPITPEESDLVTDIMQNRYMGKWSER